MQLNTNRLYVFLIILCLAGYAWIYFNLPSHSLGVNSQVSVCMIKNLSGIPCPSCGTTRSVITIINGDFFEAFKINPFGYIIVLLINILPAWILFDVLGKKKTFLQFYFKTETFLKKKSVFIPATLIVIVNWIWNIYKEV